MMKSWRSIAANERLWQAISAIEADVDLFIGVDDTQTSLLASPGWKTVSKKYPVSQYAINILMPALSPTMEKGNLASGSERGRQVRSGDVIAEIETTRRPWKSRRSTRALWPDRGAGGHPGCRGQRRDRVLAGDGEDVRARGRRRAASAPPKAAPSAAQALPLRSRRLRRQQPRRRPRQRLPLLLPRRRPQRPRSNQRSRPHFFIAAGRRLAKEAGIELARVTGSARMAA